MEQGSFKPGIEDARQFVARLEVSQLCDQRPALLEDLEPLLALFARARARQEEEKKAAKAAC